MELRRAYAIGMLAVATVVGTPVISTASITQQEQGQSEIVDLLASNQVVFGMRSGEETAERAATVAKIPGLDFVFYSLEQGSFDLPQMQVYMAGLRSGAGQSAVLPLVLRIPPIGDDTSTARSRVQQALDVGVAGIVFPHVENAEQAAVAVSAMGPALWPENQHGHLVTMLIVEDKIGVDYVREIVQTPGISVVFAGPGDLRRAYDGDPQAVEGAIQRILAACKEFDVPCGITAGVEDVGERIRQGFRVFILRNTEALTAGRRAAGQAN